MTPKFIMSIEPSSQPEIVQALSARLKTPDTSNQSPAPICPHVMVGRSEHISRCLICGKEKENEKI